MRPSQYKNNVNPDGTHQGTPNNAHYMVGSGLRSPQAHSTLDNHPQHMNYNNDSFARDNAGSDLLIRNGARVERGTVQHHNTD